MKKIGMAFVVLILALGTAFIATKFVRADAWDNNGGPFMSLFGGGKYASGSAAIYGTVPGDRAQKAVPALAKVNITAGDALVLVGSSASAMAVSETATAGDTAFFGIALNTVSYGGTVFVSRWGVTNAKVAYNAAVNEGGILITSSTAGSLTTVAAVTATLYTPVSITAWAGRAAETVTPNGSLMRVFINSAL